MTEHELRELRAAIEDYAARHGLDADRLIALLPSRRDDPDPLPEPADVRPGTLHRYPH